MRDLDVCKFTLPYAFVGWFEERANVIWKLFIESFVHNRAFLIDMQGRKMNESIKLDIVRIRDFYLETFTQDA